MFTKIRTAALSALIGLGTLAAIPATAQAEGVYLNFGGDRADTRFGVYAGDRDRSDWNRQGDRNGWDRHGERRKNDWRRSCSPERALDKAERMGLRRARVVDVNRHTIKVAGRKYNDRVVVVFGRDRGCPIIYR